ncbi:MAG: c-type cytochrome [Candidatus Dadabacteria bacterium]
MKKLFIGALSVFVVIILVSCRGASGNDPGTSYMPDMYYSRAYETYNYNDVGGELDTLKARGINYTGLPVPGTIAKDDQFVYHLTGDSAGLAAAQTLKNPLDSMGAKVDMKEAERLFLVNCGICHGPKLDGNGPLWNGGNGPYPAKPQDLIGYGSKLTDGHIFHVITYGIRTMGSYGSQLNPDQRWMVVKYLRFKQAAAAPAPAADSTGKSAPAGQQVSDSSKTKKI